MLMPVLLRALTTLSFALSVVISAAEKDAVNAERDGPTSPLATMVERSGTVEFVPTMLSTWTPATNH